MPAGRPKLYDPEQLLNKWCEYMEYCVNEGKFPTQEGFTVYGEMNPDTFYNYLSQEQYSDTKKTIDAMLLDKTIQDAVKAKNPAFLIFYLKNKFKWTDRQEIDQKITADVSIELPPDERQKRIDELLSKRSDK